MWQRLFFSLFACILAMDLCRADVSPEIVNRGKEATALVEVADGKAFGSAFCVDPAGIFITNAHVVEQAGSTVVLVLDPGRKSQQKLEAKIVWKDKDADLAILQVSPHRVLTYLEIGDSNSLVETMDVVAFGYPLGKELATAQEDYPAVTVSTGHITALRTNRDKLEAIQLDASLNPGNSGGPVLNTKGQVVGIVVAGIIGSGINFAIPSELVRTLLTKPILSLTPTSIPPGDNIWNKSS